MLCTTFFAIFSEARFPPPSGTAIDSRAPPRPPSSIALGSGSEPLPSSDTAQTEPLPPDSEATALDFGSGKSTGTGLGSGQEGGIGFSQGSSQGVVHPLFGIPSYGIQGKMPNFSGVGSSGYGSSDGTQQRTGLLVCKPENCNSLSGVCDEIYINLEPQFNSYGHQNKDIIPHHEAAGHHHQMATAPSYH